MLLRFSREPQRKGLARDLRLALPRLEGGDAELLGGFPRNMEQFLHGLGLFLCHLDSMMPR